MICLELIKRSEPRLLADMQIHYSQPKGFVGRNICYAITVSGKYYGGIVGGSATLHLVGRDAFFGLTPDTKRQALNTIVNNIFYHIEKRGPSYPVRNMVPLVLRTFRERIAMDWSSKYGDPVIGFVFG